MESQSSLGCSATACVALEWVSALWALAVRAEFMQGAECPIPAQPAHTDWSWFEQIPPQIHGKVLVCQKKCSLDAR